MTFLEKMRERNFPPSHREFNIVMSTLSFMDDEGQMFKLLHAMKKANVRPTQNTFNIILKTFAKKDKFDQFRVILGYMREHGIDVDISVLNTLIRNYGFVGRLADMSVTYSQILKQGMRPNRFTYNYLMEGFSREKNFEKAEQVFRAAKADRMAPDLFMLQQLIFPSPEQKSPERAEKIYKEFTEVYNIEPSEGVLFLLLRNALLHRDLLKAIEVLGLYKERKISWTLRTLSAFLRGVLDIGISRVDPGATALMKKMQTLVNSVRTKYALEGKVFVDRRLDAYETKQFAYLLDLLAKSVDQK
eukprot:TRINITY_DN4823_c0_g1_i3.p2 TRINITY_DN4823_c0_g1~~TRINITY_DN4823_c0_g1_i3.p2  ORF type:complete len:302 (-),score=53.73 TRINITY_DN4823_c0_g1_i3:133-1038(-)